ncbi:MAG: hypothetical protein ACRDUV_16740 [Pseudonocardiaceae bacterium]
MRGERGADAWPPLGGTRPLAEQRGEAERVVAGLSDLRDFLPLARRPAF